jgi:Flp pilus assembly pilin Flp
MDQVSKLITIFFIGAIAVLVVTHAQGFATSAGSIFTGINSLGTTLTGTNVKNVQT